MISEITCTNCGELLGHHITYQWTDFGQDPPEDDLYDPDDVVWDEAENVFCNQDCHDKYHGEGKYEEVEA